MVDIFSSGIKLSGKSPVSAVGQYGQLCSALEPDLESGREAGQVQGEWGGGEVGNPCFIKYSEDQVKQLTSNHMSPGMMKLGLFRVICFFFISVLFSHPVKITVCFLS